MCQCMHNEVVGTHPVSPVASVITVGLAIKVVHVVIVLVFWSLKDRIVGSVSPVRGKSPSSAEVDHKQRGGVDVKVGCLGWLVRRHKG